MPSHFACIGLAASSAEEMGRVIPPLMEKAVWTPGSAGHEMALWSDPSGARISFNLDRRGALQCCTPGFETKHLRRVKATRILKDNECPYCDLLHVEVLDGAGTMVYPLALQIDDLGATRDRIPLTGLLSLKIAAFAEEIRAWPDEESYEASQTSEVKYASESLIPSGLFGPSPSPHAIFTGHVTKAERRQNGETGVSFLVLGVRTLGGIYDVLASPDQVPELPTEGSVVQGTFWMVGRVAEGLKEAKPGKKRSGLF